MKPTFLIAPLCLAIAASLPAAEISHEIETTYGATSASRSNVSPTRNADVSEQNFQFQYVLSYAVPEKPIIRFGVGYDRFDFGFAGPGLIPGALQSVRLVTGLDLKISDVLIRIEAQPGFYGDDHTVNGGTFNAPIVFGASYLVSKDVQWILGLTYDGNRSNPILGGLGVRWKMADRWVLNFVPPDPRLEFKASDDLTLFVGGHLLGSTFRVNQNFGTGVSRKYGNAIVDYTEIRAGAGASWKMSGKGMLDVELGYMAYRDFDYQKVGDNFQSKNGSFYGQLGVKLKF